MRLRANELEQLVEAEEKKAAEAIRIREAENRRKQIPQPPPRVPTPPPQAAPPPAPRQESPPQPAQVKPAQPSLNPSTSTPTPPAQAPAPRAAPQSTPQPPAVQPPKPQATPVQQAAPSAPAVQPPQPQPAAPQNQSNGLQVLADSDRLLEIHGNLKKLRGFIQGQNEPISMEQVKQRDGSIKEKAITIRTIAGDMRRTLTRTMGQLTDVAGSNSKQVCTTLIITSQHWLTRLADRSNPRTPRKVTHYQVGSHATAALHVETPTRTSRRSTTQRRYDAIPIPLPPQHLHKGNRQPTLQRSLYKPQNRRTDWHRSPHHHLAPKIPLARTIIYWHHHGQIQDLASRGVRYPRRRNNRTRSAETWMEKG